MNVLVDTNILFSALLFPNSIPAQALERIQETYRLIICDQNINELKNVVSRKAPRLLKDVDKLLSMLFYDLIPALDYVDYNKIEIRDVKDQPILNAAVAFGVDIIVTGDKDFLCLKLERPKIMTASEFIENY